MPLTKEDCKEIIAQVMENKRKLEKCSKPHNFSIDTNPEKVFNKTFKCPKCGGTVSDIYKMWYERGLKDAKIRR